MANITITRGTTLPDSSAKSDFHGLVDNASIAISNIENADVSNSAAIAASKLNLATIAQDMAMSGKVINFAKGSDIASATTTDIGAATGNFVDVTGTTTITGLGTVQAGSIRFVRFTGILTLTHNGTSLILPTTANITTAANDRAIFSSLGSGNWICLSYQRADGTALGSAYTPTASNALSGSVIQVVNTQSGAVSTGTTTTPVDDTIPQNTEGTEFLTRSITPSNSSNKLKIDVVFCAGFPNNLPMVVALHQDTTADAIAAVVNWNSYNAEQNGVVKFSHYMTAGTTSATTFKVRAGMGSAGTVTFNGAGSSRLLGGVMASSITITEIKA